MKNPIDKIVKYTIETTKTIVKAIDNCIDYISNFCYSLSTHTSPKTKSFEIITTAQTTKDEEDHIMPQQQSTKTNITEINKIEDKDAVTTDTDDDIEIYYEAENYDAEDEDDNESYYNSDEDVAEVIEYHVLTNDDIEQIDAAYTNYMNEEQSYEFLQPEQILALLREYNNLEELIEQYIANLPYTIQDNVNKDADADLQWDGYELNNHSSCSFYLLGMTEGNVTLTSVC